MILYHGSKNPNLEIIKKRQAQAGEGVEVPTDELLEAVYLSPDYGYALAMAVRPEGLTNINTDNKTITFENSASFDPEAEVYVYQVDIPDEQVRQIDELQSVVENRDGVVPVEIFRHRAGDIEQYYKIITETKENRDNPPEFKLR